MFDIFEEMNKEVNEMFEEANKLVKKYKKEGETNDSLSNKETKRKNGRRFWNNAS